LFFMSDSSVGRPLAGTSSMGLFSAEIERTHVLVGHFAMFAARPGIPGQHDHAAL
jgi:hypothetical protein